MNILVVDDNEFNRQLLEMVLDDHGYQSVFACNGKEAIDCFDSQSDIDLILMDVNMPVMDGLEATKIIKQKANLRYTPIIFVTALDDQETLANCLSIGGDDFIPKPINEEVLAAKLKAHQRTTNYHRELQSSHEELTYHRLLMEREHNIVENIFSRCMGKNDLSFDNVQYYVSPMSQFNGDVYLVTPSPLGGIYVLLGDFTGHGLAAAIGCLPVSDIFFAMTKKKASVGDIAKEINSKLQDLLPDNMFFCATIVELDQSGNRLNVWSGGMNDMLILDSENKLVAKLQAQHMPLGILERSEFDSFTEIVTPFEGCYAYFYTDGIVEAKNAQGDMLGEEYLEQALTSIAAPRIEKLKDSLQSFVGETAQSDDIAIVEVKGQKIQSGDTTVDKSKPTNPDANYSVMPWHIGLTLKSKELKNPTVIEQLIKITKSIKGASQHGDFLFTLISELYSNSLEHGLLRLDSTMKENPEGFEEYYSAREARLAELKNGHIQLDLKVEPPGEGSGESEPVKLRLTLTDSGNGFDFSAKKSQESDDDLAFSRGMTLVESLCDELQYSNGGKTVSIVYSLQN